ncbi:MAG: hypothetical protein GX059_01315 [Clostridiales bacterium]|nr:hypothetical protein [Clostridiales bacterium]
MDVNSNNWEFSHSNYHEDEISLREILISIWKNKVFIILTTVAAGIIAGIISYFAIEPVYHARMGIAINMPDKYYTKYGEYTLPITTNEEYVDLITTSRILQKTIADMGYAPGAVTIEGLRERISVTHSGSKSSDNNSFTVSVASGNPEDARRLADVLYDNYIDFIDAMVAEGAVKHYINYYTVRLQSLKVELKTKESRLNSYVELLGNTPKFFSGDDVLGEILTSDGTSDFIIVDDIINPNYTQLEMDIIEVKQEINAINRDIAMYGEYLEELKGIRSKLGEYYESGGTKELGDDMVRVSEGNIYLVSEPVEPGKRTSPSHAANIVIGIVLGLFASVMIIWIREYILNKEQ